MTSKEILCKVTELKELEQLAKEIESEMEAIKDEIKGELTRQDREEMTAGVFTIRWKPVTSKRFDSRKFKEEHADLYGAYQKVQTSRRFTIS